MIYRRNGILDQIWEIKDVNNSESNTDHSPMPEGAYEIINISRTSRKFATGELKKTAARITA